MQLRKARFSDVENIYDLIGHYAGQGLMLPRPRNSIYEGLRDFILAEDNGRLIGVGALQMMWEDLAEIRSLAVLPDYARQGVGRQIVEELTQDAYTLKVKTLFTLTYQPGFFQKQGFHEVSKQELSPKVWKVCINCVKFPNCDETALIKAI